MHLLAAISPHGFGHIAQVAPVVNALRTRLPDLRVTLRTTASCSQLEKRFSPGFALQCAADDFGMRQHSALRVDVEASAAGYRELHRDWERRVDTVARALEGAAPDLVLADVPYLTLAGATRAGIPAIGMSCLNWLTIYHHYCAERPEAPVILEQMETAYAAVPFLRTRPAMPMPELPYARDIGPVMAVGSRRREELDAALGLEAGERLVLVTLGGIDGSPVLETWPVLPGVRWVMQRSWHMDRADVAVLEDLGMGVPDLLASCDLSITKPGYGAFTEAAGCGVPVLYVTRGDWPEEPYLVEWLAGAVPFRAVSPEAFASGRFGAEVEALLGAGPVAPVPPDGVEEAVEELATRLCG